MKENAQRPGGHFFLDHSGSIVLGFAAVDDKRQTGFPSGFDMHAKASGLGIARAVLIVIVEPGLTDSDHFGVPG